MQMTKKKKMMGVRQCSLFQNQNSSSRKLWKHIKTMKVSVQSMGSPAEAADRQLLKQQESEPDLTGTSSDGPWANLMTDALAEVFSRLPFEERLRTVPLVCKRWRSASFDPACWRNVDMEGWFQNRVEKDYCWEFECEPVIERLVQYAVDRSCGQLEELRTRHCTDDAINYIADRCPSLICLSISNSLCVTDKSVTNLASGCTNLKVLDLSDCYNISSEALEAVGRNCKSLVWLNRNMVDKTNRDFLRQLKGVPGGDEEAIVVSKHMVNLKHLEMMKTSLSNRGLAHLARGCGQLKSLNLACCTSLSPEALDRVSEKCPNITDFVKPITPRMHVESNRLRVLFPLATEATQEI